MLDAIADAYLNGGGFGPDFAARTFRNLRDDALARECIENFGLMEADSRLDFTRDDPTAPGASHMDRHHYNTADLAEAFGRLRASLAEGAGA